MGERRPHRAETPDVEVRGDESQTNTLYSPPWKTIDVFFSPSGAWENGRARSTYE